MAGPGSVIAYMKTGSVIPCQMHQRQEVDSQPVFQTSHHRGRHTGQMAYAISACFSTAKFAAAYKLHGSQRPRWPHGSATVAGTIARDVSKHAPHAEGGGCNGCGRGCWVSGADAATGEVEEAAAAAAAGRQIPKFKSAIIVLGEIDGATTDSSEISQPSLSPFSRAAASCCPGRGTGMEARARHARHVRKHETPGTCRAGASVCISTIMQGIFASARPALGKDAAQAIS